MAPLSPPLHRVCAVIPAYNLEKTIADVVRGTREQLEPVVVVDDGSTDETARRAQESGAHIIRVPENRGKGWALRRGFAWVLEGYWDGVVTLDGDLQHDPRDIPTILEARRREQAEIVIGSRMSDATLIPPVRYWTNRVGVFCISWAAGQPLEDTQSGFRFYSRRVIESIPLKSTRYDAETEITIKAGLLGMKIACVPIRTIYHEGDETYSHYRPFTDTFHISMVFLKSLAWRRGIPL